jgi:hypothetical protein
MFSPHPLNFTHPAVLAKNLQARSRIHKTPVDRKRARRQLVRIHPQTSYWLTDTNEMAAIKTFLIIPNHR